MQLEARVRTEIAEAETQRVEASRALGDAALAIAAADGAGAMGVARRLASMPSAVIKSVLLARLAELGPGEAALRAGALLADGGALGERAEPAPAARDEPAPAAPSHGAGAPRRRAGERASWREQWRSSPTPWRSWQAGGQAGPADHLPEGFRGLTLTLTRTLTRRDLPTGCRRASGSRDSTSSSARLRRPFPEPSPHRLQDLARRAQA